MRITANVLLELLRKGRCNKLPGLNTNTRRYIGGARVENTTQGVPKLRNVSIRTVDNRRPKAKGHIGAP